MSAGCARSEWLANRVSVIMTGAEERDRLLRTPRWRWYLIGFTRGRWTAPRPTRPPAELYAPCGP